MAENASTFSVTVANTRQLYNEATALERSGEFPQSYLMGTLKEGGGIFTEMYPGLRFTDQGHFHLDLTAFYSDPKLGIWSLGEMGQLDYLMGLKDPGSLTGVLSSPDGGYSQIVINRDKRTHHLVRIGWENGRKQWTSELKRVDQLLREESYPHLRGALEQSLDQLISSDQSLPVDLRLSVGLRVKPLELERPQPFPLEDFGSFVKVVDEWKTLVLNTVVAISEVKGIPQTGRLII